MQETKLQVIELGPEQLSQEMALRIGEHLAHTITIQPSDGSPEVTVVMKASHRILHGGLALPSDDVMILSLHVKGISSSGLYLCVQKNEVSKVEDALFGLMHDHETITFMNELTYFNDEDKPAAVITQSISCATARLVAVWFDISAFVADLAMRSTTTTVPVLLPVNNEG